MKLTVVGCGDAFGSGGRGNACFRLDVGKRVIAFDFGATALSAWRGLGFGADEIDAVVISHLHGDHFGGLPFLLLCLQYEIVRSRPLTIVGPKGLGERLSRTVEDFYPGVEAKGWRFGLQIIEIEAGGRIDLLGLELTARAVNHSDAMPCLGFRLSDGRGIFAYSGDTAWTGQLAEIADGSDLFIVECYSDADAVPGHLDWPTLISRLHLLRAKRIAVTHMGGRMRGKAVEVTARGLLALDDGQIIEF